MKSEAEKLVGAGEGRGGGTEEQGERGTFAAPLQSHRPPLFCFFSPFFFAAELGMGCSYPFIDQRFISSRLIQVDASAEWRSFVSRTGPLTPSSSSSPPAPLHKTFLWDRNKHQHARKHKHAWPDFTLPRLP